ncbi:MAG: peptide deformylase [candidate division WOR-3 bacterium]
MSPDTGTCRRILLYGNPILRTIARQIDKITPEIIQLIADLKATMIRRDGVGLAANQIGAPVAIFALNPQAADIDRPPTCLINPQIVATEGNIETEEGCLSFPDIFEVLSRPEMVIVKGVDDTGKETRLEATGLLARAIIHEYEHLQGILFIDHLSEVRRKMLASRLKELQEEEQKECG